MAPEKRERDDDELLAAYIDGVAELTPDERKRVEAKLGELDVAGTRGIEVAATKAMIDKLRALPPEGNEPDWRAMQARIAKAIDEAPRPWWRRWFVPAGGFAVVVGAALLLFTMRRDQVTPMPTAEPVAVKATVDAAVPVPAAQPAPATELWLDGQLVDVGDVDPESLFDDLDAPDAVADDVTVDQLDDRALDNLDRWLDRKKS